MGMINSYYSYRALICWKLLVKENGSGRGSGSNQEYESYQIISCNLLFLFELYVNYNPHHRKTRSYRIYYYFLRHNHLWLKKKKNNVNADVSYTVQRGQPFYANNETSRKEANPQNYPKLKPDALISNKSHYSWNLKISFDQPNEPLYLVWPASFLLSFIFLMIFFSPSTCLSRPPIFNLTVALDLKLLI